MSFQGKVVLITGASSGIGADAARHLARLGASISMVGRIETRLNEVASQIKAAGGPEPLTIVADVTKDAEKIINDTTNHFAKLDVLVNNAGFTCRSTLEDHKMELLDNVMNTNLRSVIRLTQLAVPHLEKTKGNIINVSSIAGLRYGRGQLSYSLSKAAVAHFTTCTSLELGPKRIRVNAINPAVIDTPIFERAGYTPKEIEELKKNATETYPVGRYGRVEDTSNAIAFLANDASSFINGVLLPVDGGALNTLP